MFVKRFTPLLLLVALGGCEQIGALLELPDPKKDAAFAEAEGKAIGGACRHSGRALEDCYTLNPKALKAAVFAGWREMNDYMQQNNLQSVAPQLPPPVPTTAATPPQEAAKPAASAEEGRPRRSRTSS